MTGRAYVLHLDPGAIRAEVARQARIHGVAPPSGAVVDTVTHLLGVMFDEHRAAVIKETIARICTQEGHRANDITGLDSTQLEYLCGRCGTRWNKDRDEATETATVELLQGCPVEYWEDGVWLVRCGAGARGRICARHGPFEPAARCTADPACQRPTDHGGLCWPREAGT